MILQGKKKKINIPVNHTKIMHMKALLFLISCKLHNLFLFHLPQNRNDESNDQTAKKVFYNFELKHSTITRPNYHHLIKIQVQGVPA